MKSIALADILELSVPERLQLIEDIWASITDIPDALEVTEAQRAELERRYEDYKKDPTVGSPRPEVKAKILSRLSGTSQ